MRRHIVAALAMLAAGAPTSGLTRSLETNVDTALGQRTICKNHQEVGSLVKTRRVCRTVSQWTRVGQAAKGSGRTMQEAGMIYPLPGK